MRVVFLIFIALPLSFEKFIMKNDGDNNKPYSRACSTNHSISYASDAASTEVEGFF